MLSRVANSLYWMSRQIERAENVARIVDVNFQLLLDFRSINDRRLAEHWMPIVQSTGDEELFRTLYKDATGQNVTEFLTFRTENPNSIITSIAQARENARMVRDQITREMWEEINRIYLFLKSPKATEVWKVTPDEFFHEIKSSSLLLQGLCDATIPHTEGWNFMQVGKFIERADKTTRIIDVRYQSFPDHGAPAGSSQMDTLEWAAVLRSCSAWDAYRQQFGADVDPRKVVAFLTLDEDFPRSVIFSVIQLNHALRRISGVAEGRFINNAEKLAGRLVAELQFSTIDEIFDAGLHGYLDQLQLKLNNIGAAMFDAYIFQQFNNPEAEMMVQQEEQQQQ